jgi:alpha-galactosidase
VPAFRDVVALPGPDTLAVYEHGWQSWSPAGLHPATATTPRPARAVWQTMAFRPERPAPATGAQGEGLLAVREPSGRTTVVSAPDPAREVASIRTRVEGDRLVVSADTEVEVRVDERGLLPALEHWADDAAGRAGGPALRSLPAGWCSWYYYWTGVTEADVLANLAALDELDLDVGVVQVDDGHQSGIGDWLSRSPAFGQLADLAAAVTATGRRAGIWTAPFLVGADSELATAHPEWLVRGAVAAERHWDQQVDVLDVTHPGAREHLSEVYTTLAADGFSYHKVDFLYAGAMEGGRHEDASPLDAYRLGVQTIREAIGDDAVLVGCGAPLLPSIGLFDAMRISPDVDPAMEPPDGDLSQPGMRSALASGRARAWQSGRLWVNDPDCLLVRPQVGERTAWAEHVEATGGLAVVSDPLRDLDDAGLELLRRVLRPTDPARRASWDPDAGPDQGAVVPAAGLPA